MPDGGTYRLWNKNFVIATVSNLFYAFVFFTLMATLAGYATERYSVDEGIAGLTVSIFVVGSLVMRIFAGKYLEIVGRRRMMFLGGAMSMAAALCYFLPVGLGAFIAFRVLNGMAWGLICNVLNTLVVDYIPPHRRGEGIGFFTLSNILATAVGPLLGLLCVDHFGYRSQFWLIAAISFVPLVLLPFLKVRELELTQEERRAARASFRLGDVFEPKAVPIALVAIVMTTCYSALPAFIRLYSDSLGFPWVAPLYFVAYAAVVLFSRPLSGRLLDRVGDNPVLYPAISFFGLGVFVISFATSPVFFFASAALQGVGYGALFSAFQAVAVNAAPPHRLGLAMSTYYVFADAGMGIGPFVWGAVVHRIGYAHNYLAETCVIFFGLFLYWLLHGRTPAARRKQRA
ncbi:MAG: MFS transporter [Clostridiales Family XIII bacterium]|jgi:MFS family permease|nr:MFS transporter [Clostridiales Family XIII bacterium]